MNFTLKCLLSLNHESAKRTMRIFPTSLLVVLILGSGFESSAQDSNSKPTIPFGIFLASIEEGGRIFTPIRLLPFSHPESEGHQFPNALQLYGTELDVLLRIGHEAGYDLRPTLMRYPKEPSPSWPYAEFLQPDTSFLRTATVVHRPAADSPLKGLRAVYFVGNQLVAFIVDTRNLTLAERGMKRATSMGLDLTRADFLDSIAKAGKFASAERGTLLIFGLR